MSATIEGDAMTLDLGEHLRALRLADGMSQRQLAEKAGVGYPYISKVENGLEVPGEDTLTAIAIALAADADELMLLANRVPAELRDIIRTKTSASVFLRKWRSGEISDADVDRLITGSDSQ